MVLAVDGMGAIHCDDRIKASQVTGKGHGRSMLMAAGVGIL